MVLSPPAGISATAVEDAAAAEGLRPVVRALEAEGRRDARGLAWFTGPARVPAPQREMYPEGKYDLGMAHCSARRGWGRRSSRRWTGTATGRGTGCSC